MNYCFNMIFSFHIQIQFNPKHSLKTNKISNLQLFPNFSFLYKTSSILGLILNYLLLSFFIPYYDLYLYLQNLLPFNK